MYLLIVFITVDNVNDIKQLQIKLFIIMAKK